MRYGGALAGSALTTRTPALRLREGRAWGRAMAAFHWSGSSAGAAKAIVESLREDEERVRQAGGIVEPPLEETAERLIHMLEDYAADVDPIPGFQSPELELRVPLASRAGRRPSSRYALEAYLDGVAYDEDGRPWVVEFKLRGALSPYERLALDRQGLRYAWAWWAAQGRQELPAGVIFDERLNALPEAPKINKDGKPSRDKRQMIRPAAYELACRRAGVEPDPDALEAFRARRWQERTRLPALPAEVELAGQELASIAANLAELERGRRVPVRAPGPRCSSCEFRPVCPSPTDRELVDALFERVPAKRDRKE